MIYIITIIFIIGLYLVTLYKTRDIMSYSSTTIGNYFIKKYGESGNITPLKLIKLVYIAYGWFLALKENAEQLVSEKPQAWERGPVFPNLYHNVKNYGKSAIKEPINEINSDKAISDEHSKFLDRIWEIYGKNHDGIYLSAITHTPETPWSETYPKGYNLEIPDNLIYNHYKSKMQPKTVEA